MDRQKILIEEAIKNSPVFSCLNEPQLEEMLKSAAIENYKIGKTICRADSPCDAVFVVLEGKIRIVDPLESSSTLISFSRAGDLLTGDDIQEDSCRFSYTARAATNCLVLRISLTQVRALCTISGDFKARLEQALSILSTYRELRQFQRFNAISFWTFRPVLFRCAQLSLEANTTVGSGKLGSLFVMLSGSLQSDTGVRFNPGDYWQAEPQSMQERNGQALEFHAIEQTRLLILTKQAYEEVQKYNPESVLALENALANAEPAVPKKFLESLANAASEQANQEPVVVPMAEGVSIKLRRQLKRFPFVRQHNAMDCGAACLAMIVRFYGRTPNFNYIRELAGVGRYGTSMLFLAEAAEKLGFISRGLRASYPGLMKLKAPFICHWKQNHFVVAYEVRKDGAIIGDPGDGIIKLDPAKFNKDYSGVVLELSPTQDFGKDLKKQSPFKLFIPLFLTYKREIINILIATLVFQILMFIMPFFTQILLDKVIVHQNLSLLNTMLLGMAIFTLFETAISFIRGFLLSYVALRIDQSLFVQFYRHVFSLPLSYFDNRTIGDIFSRFGENEKIRDLLAGSGLTVLLDAIIAIVSLAIIFLYNVQYGWAVVIYLSVFIVLVVCYTPFLKTFSRRVFDKHVVSNSYIVESLRAVETIKAAAAERLARTKWEGFFTETLNVRFQEFLVRNIAQVVSKLVQLAGQVVMLWLGAQLVIKNELTIGQLMALNMMTGMASAPLMRIVEMWDQLQDVSISMERLADVLDAEPEEIDPSTKVLLHNMEGRIRFENVTFRYSQMDNINILLNVSFEARPGQMIGIAGRSGSGKSTLMRLVQGLYKSIDGRIYIDDMDITQVSLSDLRKNIGVVSQNDYLFRTTIRENLSLHKQDAGLEEVIESAKVAGIHEFIMSMPNTYETLLSEGGFNFSGGQRQRLSIARSLLHNPKILIFDEATSALDTESERLIQQSLVKMRENRLVFVVAHRLSTIKDADIILVIDRGQIVERGAHQALLDERGLYYYLCSQQTVT